MAEQRHQSEHKLRAGMVGMGMIFDETYRPFFEAVSRQPLYDGRFGPSSVALSAVGFEVRAASTSTLPGNP